MMCLICGSRICRSRAILVSIPHDSSPYIHYFKACMITDALHKQSVSIVCDKCMKDVYDCTDNLRKISVLRFSLNKDSLNLNKPRCFLCASSGELNGIRLSEIDSKRIVINKLMGYNYSTFPLINACDLCYKVVNDLHRMHEKIFRTAMRSTYY